MESSVNLQEPLSYVVWPIVLTGVIIGFTLHTVLHMAPSIFALIGALVWAFATRGPAALQDKTVLVLNLRGSQQPLPATVRWPMRN